MMPSPVYRGVRLNSRYNCPGEIETMRTIVRLLEMRTRHVIEIFYDSKACATVNISVQPMSREDAEEIAHLASKAMVADLGGWNFISVGLGQGDWLAWLDPSWPEDVAQ